MTGNFVLDAAECQRYFGRVLSPLEFFILYQFKCKNHHDKDMARAVIRKKLWFTKPESNLVTDDVVQLYSSSLLNIFDLENYNLSTEFRLGLCSKHLSDNCIKQ